ncbi:SUKH-4 family immunity protein [Leucobacter aridicollis]|uniref:SUKH-4 family immunity protein n=1 Tax=Leucobacter aridicollis TaxID=283878 RepID=UPI000E650F4E|nr:SUKH-4 family immunity protein [Leucobacter aridicollis]UTX52597.1 SUKH-4 family immunity protein [Leucobacter aridicollis]
MSDVRTGGLGFQFYADAADVAKAAGAAQRLRRPLRVIGHLHSPEEFLVAEDAADGSVWVLAADHSAEWPLNVSRSALDACLTAFGRYLDSGSKASGPAVYSADEMRERLERFARGEVVSRAPQKPPAPHRARLKRLHRELKAADRSVFARNSWWSGVLEDAKNNLL